MHEPKGWTIDKRRKTRPYRAEIVINKVLQVLGYFETPEEAHAAFVKAREENPRMPANGGAKPGTYSPPRKICPNCDAAIATTKYAIHHEACTRHYPNGRKPWDREPNYRRKPQYIKKADRITKG